MQSNNYTARLGKYEAIPYENHLPLKIDDREFSSPVCYLDFDDMPVPSQSAFCVICKEFMNAWNVAEEKIQKLRDNEVEFDDLLYQDYDQAKVAELNHRSTICETTENIAVTASNGCLLCLTFFEHLRPDEQDFLNELRDNSNQTKSTYVFEYQRVLQDGDKAIGLEPSPRKLSSMLALIKVESKVLYFPPELNH